MDVVQHSAGGVARVGSVYGSVGQLPNQPGIYSAEEELALLGARACTRHLVQQPGQFGRREIRINDQARRISDVGLQAIRLHAGTELGCALVLPNQRVMYGLPTVAIPDDRRFSLVGDTDGDQVGGRKARLGQHIPQDAALRFPYLLRVVFYPARLGKDLGELFLSHLAQPAFFVKQNSPGTRRALVERKDIFHIVV